MTAAPVIHVVDDDASFRKAVARLLQVAGYKVSLYESGDQLLERPPEATPGCILLDVQMPGLSGMDLQERLSKLESVLPIIFLTGQADVPNSVRAMRAGAEDFLIKPVSKLTLFAAVERALGRFAERQKSRHYLQTLRNLVATLTRREYEVFTLIVRGRLNKQIAYELGTSERTIKAHRHSIMQKLQVRSLAESVSIAERIGILEGRTD